LESPESPEPEPLEPYSLLDWAPVESVMVGRNEFVLARHKDDWVVRVDDRVLMSNRVYQSEIALAELAFERIDFPQRVLVGGLGLGYTLRAALDLLPIDGMVTVAELVPALVDWNRRLLNHLHDSALDDPRCEVVVGDVFELISQRKRTFDVMLLDVDNGPQALSQVKNQRLYGDGGTRACWEALVPGGVLAVWSANPNAKYVARLKRFGFEPEVVHVPARPGGYATHVLFIAQKRKA